MDFFDQCSYPLNGKGVHIRPSVIISVTTNVFHEQPRAYIYVPPDAVVWNTVKIGSQQPKAYISALDECSEQPKAYIYVLITKLCLCLCLFDLNSIGCS